MTESRTISEYDVPGGEVAPGPAPSLVLFVTALEAEPSRPPRLGANEMLVPSRTIVSFVLAHAFVLVSPGCLTKQQPAAVVAPAAAPEVLVTARRALVEQGLTAATQDDEAGVLYSDWVVHGSGDDSAYVYRLVILVDDRGQSSSVTVRAETQSCPPHVTVFDRCTATPGKIVPKAIQEKIDAVGAMLAG